MSDPETQETSPAISGMPYQAALLDVIKGLRRDPILLFGIGAGILVVAVLAATTDPIIVLIVAAFFVVVLGARLHMRTQELRRGADVKATLVGSTVKDSDVGVVEEEGSSRVRAFVGGSKVSGSRIGTVGSSRPPKSRDDS